MRTGTEEPVVIDIAEGQIEADLRLPRECIGLVVFAHGSGSSRFSRRNRDVASYLEDKGLGTLLVDLLTRQEERIDEHTREYRFNVNRLGYRVVTAIDWARGRPELATLPLGCFGASTGAAAALLAAADRPSVVRAVVSRGGRPDLAGDALPAVRAPTLLIVGGDDEAVLEMNREALRRLNAPADLAIVPGATHLFEEPGTLEQVMELAAEWFIRHLGAVYR
jgi:dienelactone hydrolase